MLGAQRALSTIEASSGKNDSMSRPRNNRVGRNDPCPCGSGKKHKHCHGGTISAAPAAADSNRSQRGAVLREHFIPHAAVVWIAKDIYGQALEWDAAKRVLGSINLESAILSMAMINAVSAELALGGNLGTVAGAMKVRALADYLFPPEFRGPALEVYLKNSRQTFIPLAPQACIAMTEACLRYCDRNGGDRFQQPHQNTGFTHVLFSFHEQLMREDLTAGLNMEKLTGEQFRYLVRNYLAANFETNFVGLIRRHYLMFEVADPAGVLHNRAGKNAAAWFTEIAGTDPTTYRILLLFVMHHGHAFTIDSPDLTHLVYNMETMLQNVAPESAAIYRRLHNLAVVEDHLPAADFTNWESAVYGMHYVRRKPMLHLVDAQHVCLYKHLLPEKFFAGTVHVLSELAASHPPAGWHHDSRERVFKVRREFGYLFEDYVRKILSLLFGGPDVVMRFGLHRDDGGECDALVVVGRTALAFEFVHHPWSLAERARGESASFVPHLADNIRKAGLLCAQIGREQCVADLERRIDTALPIVITSEMMAINEMTALTWQRDLIAATSAEMVLGHGLVQPVQTLSLIQLENLDHIASADSAASIVAILSERARDPLWRFSGHSTLRQRLGRSRRLREFEEAAYRSFDELGAQLFKQ